MLVQIKMKVILKAFSKLLEEHKGRLEAKMC